MYAAFIFNSFVGVHKVTLTTSGRHMVELNPSEYIAVIPGDTMGLGVGSAPIPLSSRKSDCGGTWHTHWMTYRAEYTFGQEFQFDTV